MPATVWKGHLTFGLVSIPVRLFRAARRERISFRQLYLSGMSVGREHIASLINTLALAYVGASMPLLLLFLWRGANRTVYAGVFLVVACLELYGTAIGTWRWQAHLPGTGISDGNPPSGVASGYVWFDVMALLVAPAAVSLLRRRPAGRRRRAGERPLRGTTPA